MSSFEYGKENRWHDQYFAKALAVTDEGVDTDAQQVGTHQGSLAVTLCANGEVTASGLEVSYKESATEDGVYAAPANVLTLALSGTYADGAVMGKLVLPDCEEYVKVTCKGTVTGKVDVLLSYLAR